MKRIVLATVFFALSTSLMAVPNKLYQDYIAQWLQEALFQQQEYQIPASITLAQGLLESNAGTSELAVNAKNHFGIKCTSDWMGDVYRHDDETKDECFRMYLDAAESYSDHSKFLHRTRYQRLFQLPLTDYQGWAQGLKDCGYATDPLYPQKLIRIIEEYRLDTLAAYAPGEIQTPIPAASSVESAPIASSSSSSSSASPASSDARKAVVVTENPTLGVIGADADIEEYTEPLSAYRERKEFFAWHARYRTNGCRYVLALEGDTYASVAFSLNVRERKLREDNDALGRTLQVGDRIYLSRKKSHASKDHPTTMVTPGESVWEVAQREGIRVKSLLRLNDIPKTVRVFQTRQQILLRHEKKEKK